MDESDGKDLYNKSSSDDDEEYEENRGNRLLGFMFGNVDNSGDLDADYLDEDAKEHLSALADKLGSSLSDIDLLYKSPHTPADPLEQDYDDKAENAVDYEDIDEQYEGPEIQAVTEEDYLLPKKEYFSADVRLAPLKPKSSVFDDEDYDEEEESDKDPDVDDREAEAGDTASDVLEDKTVEFDGQPGDLRAEKGLESNEDVKEADYFLDDPPDAKDSTPLPTLFVDDGMVILRFSEIFAIQETPEKHEKRDRRYFTDREKYICMDASKLVEEDEEAFLKNHSSFNSYVKREEVLQPEVSLLNEDCTGVLKFGDMCDAAPTSTGLVELRKDTCVMGAPFKKELTDDLSVRLQSQSSVDVFLLDQQDWEQNILWDTSPAVSEISEGSNQSSGPDLEGLLITGTESENEQKSVNPMNSKKLGQTDHKMFLHDSTVILESFGSRSPARPQSYSVSESRLHPQLLRLDSFSKVNGLEKGDAGGGNLELLDHGDFRRFSKLSLQSRDITEEGWLDSVIWEPEEAFCKPKLVLNFQDEQMLFEIPDNKDNNCLKLHAGAVVLSRYFPSSDERMMKIQGHKTHSNWQFNISNDKFYMTGKTSQQLQSYTNKGSVHTFRVLHSAPALKLQTMKLKLSNKDIANFHRPKALWYPHDKELVIKEQGKLPTQGPMKIVVKSLGGKGSKLHVDAEEKISSVKAKASKKLDFKSTETVKMFYLGKELEDDKSLAAQNVQPNSLIHLVRTKVHLLPEAQKLPGENKPLRPPGAFRKKSDLSVKDGHVVLMEYCEERPLLLSNVGMGANLCTFYQKSSPEDQTGNSLRSQSDSVGNFLTLEPGDRSPFIGDIRTGSSQSSVETNMYRAPLFPQKVQSTDYLLVRSAKGKLSLRRIDRVAVVGQQEPHMEVMSPGSKNLQTYMGNRLLVYVYREFAKHGLHHRIGADDLSFTFSNLSDAIIRKNMRICAVLKRDRNGKACWYMRHDFHIPPENELKKMLAPELVCSYESMLSGLYRLKHLGITRLTQPTSISSAMSLLPDEAIALAAASHIERELQITPWNLSNNFVACKSQDRANIERLEITGVGDPSGRGLGFSYVRAAPKAPTSGGHVKKKASAVRGGTSVTGTDADLRRLSMEAAREVLLKFNVPDEVIAKQTRWHRIAMIRKLSSEQAASGVKVDHTTIGKYARGQRMSFLQLQQQTREKCQEIWDRQVQSLSAFDVDDNESESEANSDLDSFAGDLENLLAAGECEEGEEVDDTSKQGKSDGVKGLKMRRRASQVEAEEEFEDEAAEAAELCRLLMDDNQGGQKKNKKKAKAVGDGAGLFPHSRANSVFSIVEPVKKALVIAKNPIAAQPEVSISGNENTVREATKTTSWQLDSSIGRPTIPTKPKTVKENGFAPGGQAVKVKILGDNLKTTFIKEKKSARENFVCGACGQYGHMRTNKHCPRYRESTELQPENIDKEKGAGKSSSVDQPGPSKLKVKKKQNIPKGGVKIALVEAPDGDLSSLKTKGIPLKFRYGGPSDKLADKHGLEAPGSSEQAAASDIDSVVKSALKVDEIVISKKTKPRSLQAESDTTSRLALPAVSDRGRGYVESPKQSVSAQPAIDMDGDQVVSSMLSISVQQPSFSTDRDQPEAHKPRLVIRPPTEREQPQKKIIIRRSEEKTDQDWFSHEESPRFESRKTKRMVELAGFQTRGKQENLKLIEESKNKAREERMWWEEEERRRRLERHREERARRHYEDDVMIVEEPEMKVVEIERYQEVIRRDWEEEQRQKAKKKKTTKRKQQHEIREDYLDDYSTRRNDGRIRDRDRSAKRRPVTELRHYGADYVPPTKRRRGGEVGLANILERIVETLRENTKVSMLFLKPVTKKEAPDYLDIIERPMDLSTIREKVRRMEYKGRRDFRHDVWQIKYNAHKYNNGRNPGIPPLADELLELCDYLLEEHQEEIADAEAGIQSNGE